MAAAASNVRHFSHVNLSELSKDSLKAKIFPKLPCYVPDTTGELATIENLLSRRPFSQPWTVSASEVYQVSWRDKKYILKFQPMFHARDETYTAELALLKKLREISCIIPIVADVVSERATGRLYPNKGVNLRTWAQKIRQSPTLKEIQAIGIQLLSGLIALKNLNYFHRNLTLEHILIDGEQVSVTGESYLSLLPRFCLKKPGDFPDSSYWPPEAVMESSLSEKSSSWAVAFVIHYLYREAFPIELNEKANSVYFEDESSQLSTLVNTLGPLPGFPIKDLSINQTLKDLGEKPIDFPKAPKPTWSHSPMPPSLHRFFAESLRYQEKRCDLNKALINLSTLDFHENLTTIEEPQDSCIIS